MRRATSFLLAIIAWTYMGCAREHPEEGIQIFSTELNNVLSDGSEATPGSIFLTIHARHAAKSETSCELGGPDLILVDDKGGSYRPRQASESRGSSSSTGLFGIRGERKVKPHEIRAVYEVPADGVTRGVFFKGFSQSRFSYSAQ